MSRELRRYLMELLLSLLVIGGVISGIIGIRYQSYQRELERIALILNQRKPSRMLFRS